MQDVQKHIPWTQGLKKILARFGCLVHCCFDKGSFLFRLYNFRNKQARQIIGDIQNQGMCGTGSFTK